MYSIDLKTIAKMCKGKLYGKNKSGNFNISFDTRQLKENDIFIALKGKEDGHKFIPQAIKSKAAALIVNKPIKQNISYIKTEDTLKALHLLAQNYRKYYLKDKIVIGISGTCGKTTTKEILSQFIELKYKTAKNQSNFNNHIGMPITILNSTSLDTEVLICEVGINKIGEMKILSKILMPDMVLLTNIGVGHLEGFFNKANYIKEKAKILENLPYDSFAVIPDKLKHHLQKYKKSRFITFGYTSSADYKIQIKQINKDKTIFCINNQVLETNLISKGNIENISAAYAMAYELGIDKKELAYKIKNLNPVKNRMNIVEKNSKTIIIDCYNANPNSFKNALDILSIYKNKRISMIIGDMLELGDFSEQEHIKLLKKIKQIKNCKAIIYIGKYCELAKEILSDKEIKIYKEIVNFLENGYWKNIYSKSDVLLIKASNSIGLEKFVKKLEEENVL